MSPPRTDHLIERAAERLAQLDQNLLAGSGAPSASQSASRFEGASGVTADMPDAAAHQTFRPAPPAALAPSPPSPVSAGTAKQPAALVTMATLEAAGLAIAGAKRSRVADEWRVTASQLLRRLQTAAPRPDAAANMLMVTSSSPGEGKTFCAVNLAAILALGGLTEVVLVDVDSKPRSLTGLLGLGDRLGLFDLADNASLHHDDLLVPTAIEGLSILPIGRTTTKDSPEPKPHTVTRPVAVALETLSRRSARRIVILDTAPALATSDVSTLAPSVGQIALIVEAERTQHGDIEAALEMLRPCPNITLILNKVRLITRHAFGHYHDYGS